MFWSSHWSLLCLSRHVLLVLLDVLRDLANGLPVDDRPHLHGVFHVLLEPREGGSLYEAPQWSHLDVSSTVVFLPSLALVLRNIFALKGLHSSLGCGTYLRHIHEVDPVTVTQRGPHSCLWFLKYRDWSVFGIKKCCSNLKSDLRQSLFSGHNHVLDLRLHGFPEFL